MIGLEFVLNQGILRVPWGSVRSKPCFGIGNRNQDQVLVSVWGQNFFCLNLNFPHFKNLPKNHFSYDLEDEEKHLDSKDDTDIKNPERNENTHFT